MDGFKYTRSYFTTAYILWGKFSPKNTASKLILPTRNTKFHMAKPQQQIKILITLTKLFTAVMLTRGCKISLCRRLLACEHTSAVRWDYPFSGFSQLLYKNRGDYPVAQWRGRGYTPTIAKWPVWDEAKGGGDVPSEAVINYMSAPRTPDGFLPQQLTAWVCGERAPKNIKATLAATRV